MPEPRYTEAQLWARILALWKAGATFHSLVHGNRYVIVGLSEAARECIIRYESGRTKAIGLGELYALYRELYRRGNLPRDYMRDPANSLRVAGRATWHAPGAAMYALLPRLDEGIRVAEGGHLHVKG